MEYNLEITGSGSLSNIIKSLETSLKAIKGLEVAGKKIGTEEISACFNDDTLKTNIQESKDKKGTVSPMKDLAKRIESFISKYAAISPNWDGESNDDGKFTSPDAYQMQYCADMLKQETKPYQCFSEWGGGGYKPYSSREGREEHDCLVKEIYKIINS